MRDKKISKFLIGKSLKIKIIFKIQDLVLKKNMILYI
jgi:hypothetical protein